MDKKEFEFILSEGEGQYIEFKEKFGGSFAKEIVAFANASGGRIFLGIDDKKNVKNVQITNKLKSQIQDFANSCDPRIEISLEEFEGILIINVSEGNNKPYSCKEGFYLRVGPNSQKMKRDEIIEIIQSNFQFNFDDCYLRKEEEFSFTKFNDFLKENKLNNFLGDLNLLRSLRLIDKDNKFSNASILLFGNNPQMIFPSCYLECVMFKGKEGADVLDRKRINGTLFEQLKEGMFFLKKNLKVRYEFPDEKRREYYDVPLRALEEALVNSLIHRDYLFRGANITLSIHEDRVEIASPGGFPPGLKKEDFGNISIRRNELIADIFSKTIYVEKIGSGIKRMRKACSSQGNPLPVFEIDNFFIIKFYFNKKTVEKTVEKIIDAIKLNSGVTQSELEKLTGLTRRGVEWNLLRLKEKGIIERVGADKGGTWKVK